MNPVKVIEKRVFTITEDMVLENTMGRTERLIPSDWERCQFRFPNPIWEWRDKHAIAINLEITGRTFQRRQGDWWVKVRIEWVQDDEPSTFSEGWVRAGWPGNLPYFGD